MHTLSWARTQAAGQGRADSKRKKGNLALPLRYPVAPAGLPLLLLEHQVLQVHDDCLYHVYHARISPGSRVNLQHVSARARTHASSQRCICAFTCSAQTRSQVQRAHMHIHLHTPTHLPWTSSSVRNEPAERSSAQHSMTQRHLHARTQARMPKTCVYILWFSHAYMCACKPAWMCTQYILAEPVLCELRESSEARRRVRRLRLLVSREAFCRWGAPSGSCE